MTLWLNADGKLIVNADGKPVLCDDCPCRACPDVEELTVTISGVVPCVGCFSYGGGLRFKVINLSALNAVHIVTQTAPGVFTWVSAGLQIEIERFTDLACTLSDGTELYDGGITVTCVDGLFEVYAFFTSALGGSSVVAFSSSGAELNASANSGLLCSSGNFVEGGTATVEL